MIPNEKQLRTAIACAVAACLLTALSFGAGDLMIAASDGNTAGTNREWTSGADKDWAQPTGDYANTRYSLLKEINSENVKTLAPIWTFSTGVLRGHEGAPLVIGDIMYVHTPFPNIVYALDLNHDGRISWKYEPRQDPSVIPVMCCDTVNRGLAYGDGKVFLYQADTRLVALDAKTGAPVWSVKNGDPTKGATGTSAPLVVKGKVLVGIAGGEFGVRGYLTAYDIRDGKEAWRAYSMGPVRTCSWSRVRPLSSASQWVRIQASLLGKATSGRSAAAPRGAGFPMIPS
jgi:PQQ-dependent dehydrogenase (methanol/ethanol family)